MNCRFQYICVIELERSSFGTEMDILKADMANDPLVSLEQLTEIFSRLAIQEDETSNGLPSLPSELQVEILSCLPVKPLLRFKCLSKFYFNLISSRGFGKLHRSRSLKAHSDGTLMVFGHFALYTFDFDGSPCQATKLNYPSNIGLPRLFGSVASCNGLLCFAFRHELLLYNPATRASKYLPVFKSTCRASISLMLPCIGLVYDGISDDYMVLRIMKSKIPGSETIYWETILYSSRASAWEIIGNPPWGWDTIEESPSIVANNSVHWLDSKRMKIKCFDIFSRRYYEIALPERISLGYSPKLCVLRGELCVVTYYLDIWILKEYGVHESWTRVFYCPSLQWSSLFDSLSCWSSGLSVACSSDGCKILLALMGYKQSFICCDLASREARKIEISGLPDWSPRILPWACSFAPL